jgi:diguanylate cyclase (GGDEF)-like protein
MIKMSIGVARNDQRAAESPRSGAEPAPRLLIVDDVADNRAILSRQFGRRGYEIVEAEDGAQALRLIGEQTFDAVLLDVMMPGIYGTEVLRQIRTQHSAAMLPVIMVTAKTQPEDIVESLKLGANDYVTKPVEFSIALARVASQVARRRSELEAQRAKDALQDDNKRLENWVSERNAQLMRATAEVREEIMRRTATEDRVTYLAHHDTLTGLANRFSFDCELKAAASRAQGNDLHYAVLFMDLDGFKNVNDALGHSVGDALLKEVANRVRDSLAADDFVARFGGDEFAILHLSNDIEKSSTALAKRLIDVTSACQAVEGHQVFVGASIGIAIAGDEVDPNTLMKRADLAMYRAKADGRGQFRLFHPEMDAIAQMRRSLELDLRVAIARGEFEIFYQPIVNLEHKSLSGFEALLRWKHPERGLLSPDTFIPLAEETGLIVPIGEWVLRQACADATRWPSELRVAVNLSAVQFRNRNLIAVIVNALAATGLHPSRLELEITETVLLGNNAQTMEMLQQLRKAGVSISLDDFGAGYSGLGYLRSIQFDKVKIDKSFIREMASKGESLAIIQAAVGLATSLGISTTAEGLETEEQLREVVVEGCIEGQGFFFSKPLPAVRVPEMIERVLQMRRRFERGEIDLV